MAYETKVILQQLAERIVVADTLEEAYGAVQRAASVEGVKLPTYDEYKKEIMKEKKK